MKIPLEIPDPILSFWQNRPSREQKLIVFGGIGLIFILSLGLKTMPQVMEYFKLNNILIERTDTLRKITKTANQIFSSDYYQQDKQSLNNRVQQVFKNNDPIIKINNISSTKTVISGEDLSFSDFYKKLFQLENTWGIVIEKMDMEANGDNRISATVALIRGF